MRSIPRLEQRKTAIIAFLDANPWCKLLLMDGAGDLVTDSNDLDQAVECRIWIRELTVKYSISILTTLHPNPGTLKPRGHIGSEIIREAEGVVCIQKQADLRIVTSVFEHGKNRNNAPVWGAYQWDDTEKMMCSSEVPEYLTMGSSAPSKPKMKLPSEFSEDFHGELLRKIFNHEPEQRSEVFYLNIMAAWNHEDNGNMSKSRAKTFRSYYVLNDFMVAKGKQEGNATMNRIADKYLYRD